MLSHFSAVVLSGAALLATTLPAAAIEPQAAADALLAAMTRGNSTKAEYEAATLEGSDVVIRGLQLTRGGKAAAPEPQAGETAAAPAEPTVPAGGNRLTFAEARIEALADSETGVFASPRITFANGAFEGEATGTIANAVLTEVTVLDPKAVTGTGPGEAILFRTAEATDLRVTPENNQGQLTVGRIFMEAGDVVDNVPQSSKGTVEDISIPAESFAQAQFKPQTLGYEQLVLDVTWDGTRDRAANKMTVRDFTVSIQDGGDLSITGILGKLPEPRALNDADASNKASAVEVHTMTVRYDDKSLAGRILDYMAKQQGVARADYANQIAAALPFLLSSLNNPEFQNEVAAAVGAFLKDPRSLTIKFEPPAPVSGSEIVSIAGSAPQTLPDRLNASVRANTPN